MLPHIPDFALVSAIFFAAGIVKGVLGMGLPTFAMGFLGLVMPVPQAAALLTLPSLATNLWQGFVGGALAALLRRLWPFLAGIAAGVALAPLLVPGRDAGSAVLLGACLLAYGLSGLAGWHPQEPSRAMQAVLGPCVGAVTGVITAMTGVFVVPAVPYLQSLRLDRNALTQALGLSFATSTLALAALLGSRGQLDAAASVHSLLALAPALAGMFIGQVVRQDMSEASFRRWFYAALVVLGGWLVLR